MKTGLNITLFVSKEELVNAKAGGSTLIGSKVKTKEAEYQITAALDACDILDTEVRVNLSLVRNNAEEAGRLIGEAMASELDKVFSKLT
ncbi:hypothetical protein [Paenibacillus sp. MBLB4367]|uniref:hypothetical protein n=1 Tax=Paenibacillus sp. MBLB4367 TaxID=3384767 RepID=UPI0039081347